MQDFNTPMMKQYMDIKKQYQDCLLFFRMGDFYELFLEDAQIGAKVLDIVLTSRSKGKDGRIPMAGVPYHAVDSYLAKLVKAGHKVAICEQVSEPNKYGLVDRQVIRIVTPGTVLDAQSLEDKEHNYIISIVEKKDSYGLAVADLSTGLFQITDIGNLILLMEEIKRLQPTECILPDDLYNSPQFLKTLKTQKEMNIFCFHDSEIYINRADETLNTQFGKQIQLIGLKENFLSKQAASILVGYLRYTQKDKLPHFKSISILSSEKDMVLDYSTIINLELFTTLRTQEKRGTLLNHIDKTHTSMGGRMLRSWLRRPLTDKEEIIKRHNSVEEMITKYNLKVSIEEELNFIVDIERVLSRVSLGIGNARDLVALKISLKKVLEIKKLLSKTSSLFFQNVQKDISDLLHKCIEVIDTYIVEEPPFGIKEGGMIKDGVDENLDMLRKLVYEHKDWLAEMERTERETTGISNLKVRFNKVFGFYIEVSKANASNVPAHYMRKQTLVNAERFITDELKKKEDLILHSEEQIQKLEYQWYSKIVNQILEFTLKIQKAAEAIAKLDCICNFAEISELYHYQRPSIADSGKLQIEEGRHPVVEHLLQSDTFVPNDTYLNIKDSQLIILTGPNMAGKSVYIRQVALIVLLNQIGCFVPAKKAELGIVDRIFVRSGASDMISEGLSTFMVEMVETAQILSQATTKSLVIMDEIGRGTSTYDGISIAWSVAEYIVQNKKFNPKTLFATHYHELQDLENKYPKRIKNFHMAVEDEQGKPVFLYTLLPEGASHSFGIAVAKLAGLPDEVIKSAYKILPKLESRDENDALPLFEERNQIEQNNIKDKIKDIDINSMTPLEALQLLSKLKKEIS